MDARTPVLRDRIGLDGRTITGILMTETASPVAADYNAEEEGRKRASVFTKRILDCTLFLPRAKRAWRRHRSFGRDQPAVRTTRATLEFTFTVTETRCAPDPEIKLYTLPIGHREKMTTTPGCTNNELWLGTASSKKTDAWPSEPAGVQSQNRKLVAAARLMLHGGYRVPPALLSPRATDR